MWAIMLMKEVYLYIEVYQYFHYDNDLYGLYFLKLKFLNNKSAISHTISDFFSW